MNFAMNLAMDFATAFAVDCYRLCHGLLWTLQYAAMDCTGTVAVSFSLSTWGDVTARLGDLL
jgi:hypothetical protein